MALKEAQERKVYCSRFCICVAAAMPQKLYSANMVCSNKPAKVLVFWVQEQEAEALQQLRRRLQFKAKSAPSRSKPVFKPDYRLAKPPTEPKPFILATDSRFGVDHSVTGLHRLSDTHMTTTGDEEFEDEEDLDDGSGCSDLAEIRSNHLMDHSVEC